MKLTLLKKLSGNEIGTVIDVTAEVGADLIAKGVARNPTVDEVSGPKLNADQANKALGFATIADQQKARAAAAAKGGKPIITNEKVYLRPVGSK